MQRSARPCCACSMTPNVQPPWAPRAVHEWRNAISSGRPWKTTGGCISDSVHGEDKAMHMSAMVDADRPAVREVVPRATMRELLKASARGIATLATLPVLLVYGIKAAMVGRDRALEAATELLAIVPGLTGRYLRRAFLARVLAHCHPTASIGFGTIFSKVGASIGADVYIGPRCHVGLAAIEENALLAAGVHVTSGGRTHGFDDLSTPIREQQGTPTLVRIGAGPWIGGAGVGRATGGRH